jgi:hypothetical protein
VKAEPTEARYRGSNEDLKLDVNPETVDRLRTQELAGIRRGSWRWLMRLMGSMSCVGS